MINPANTPCSAFDQHRLIARGPLNDVARAAKRVGYSSTAGPVLIFDDHNSLQVELDFRGTPDDLPARLAMEAVERLMQAMTGDLAGHEEASRAFYRGEHERFDALTEHWPANVRDHLRRLAARVWADRLLR